MITTDPRDVKPFQPDGSLRIRLSPKCKPHHIPPGPILKPGRNATDT